VSGSLSLRSREGSSVIAEKRQRVCFEPVLEMVANPAETFDPMSVTVDSPQNVEKASSSPSAFARPELLAPAGDWDCAKAAVENGAGCDLFWPGTF